MFFTCSSVRSQSCERDTLKTNELILLQIGTSALWGMGMKPSTWGSGGSRSRSHDAKVRFGHLEKASLSADNFRKTLKTHLFWNALGHLAH